ncbi:MAG: hypothetical protein DRO98_03575 [Archaeoglobales archaeon]|nr:MAG: hypothetical protein DRO98_03575 [Archaeoglobales archaeon]
MAVNALKESIESAGREIIVASTHLDDRAAMYLKQGDNFWLMIGFARFYREFLDAFIKVKKIVKS